MAIYDEQGYNRRGRRKIGYKPRTTRDPYGGLSEFYALQNRNLSPADANQMAQEARDVGLTIGPTGIAPRGMSAYRSFTNGPQTARPASQPPSAPSWAEQSLGYSFTQDPNSPASIRQRLQSRADEIRMQREMGNPVQRSSPDAVAAGAPSAMLRSKYGTGSATILTPEQFAKRPEATIGGQSASAFFQDVADRQGVANKFASPRSMNPKSWRDQLSKRNLLSPTRASV